MAINSPGLCRIATAPNGLNCSQ